MSIGILLFDARDFNAAAKGAPQRLFNVMLGNRAPKPMAADDRFIMAVYSPKGFGIPIPDITYDEIRSDPSWVDAVQDQMLAMTRYDGSSSASLKNAITSVCGVTGIRTGWLAPIGFDLAQHPGLIEQLREQMPQGNGLDFAIMLHDPLTPPTTTQQPPTSDTHDHDSSVNHDDPEQWYRRGERATRDKDFKTAAAWYRMAADAGLARAQIELGDSYMYGVGVAKDEQQARSWYRQAAEQDNLVAQKRLAEALSHDDVAQAAHWYQRAAEQGDAGAMFSLGKHYEEGKGVEKDYGQAAHWYQLATEQGKGVPQYQAACCLGDLYLKHRNANGWETDERPNPLRQWTYEHGEGKNKDAAQAAYWYEKSIVLTPDDDVLDNANYVRDYKLKPLLNRYHFGAAATLSSPS